MQTDAGAFSWPPCGGGGGKYTEDSVSKIATTCGKTVCTFVNAVCPRRHACHNARLVGKGFTGECVAQDALRRTLMTSRLTAASRRAASMTGITCCTSLVCTSMTHVRNASICTHAILSVIPAPGQALVLKHGERSRRLAYPNLTSEIAQPC